MPDKPIHVAHILYSFSTGGLENGVVNIINRLPEDQYQHSIICVTDYDEAFYKRIKTNNTKIYQLHKAPGLGLKWLWQCWLLLRKLKPDVCHTRNLSALEAQLAGFMAGIKLRIHGEHGWDVSDLGGKNVKYQKLRKFFKPLVNQYIALSIEAKDYLLDKIGVKTTKVNHICNGVDINLFTAEKTKEHFDDFAIDKDDIVFGTVGRLAAVKNQTYLLKAFVHLVQANPDKGVNLKLIIIGDGVLMPELISMVEAAQLEKQVLLAGQRSDVAQCMKAMDIFVLPSLAEGISNTLLEAMATGLPYIATAVGGNGDLIFPPHKTTHLVPINEVSALAEAMAQYVNQPSLISEHSELVRQHCEKHFSIEHMVNKYHKLYQLAKRKGT